LFSKAPGSPPRPDASAAALPAPAAPVPVIVNLVSAP
jgi:hypothetical protein